MPHVVRTLEWDAARRQLRFLLISFRPHRREKVLL